MDEKDKNGADAEPKTKRIDVSFAQVAGSAVAAVVAALLAGKLGVYGTFLGAGVVSVVATTGGSFLQHVFHRTGKEIKNKTAQVQPKVRQVTLQDRRTGEARTAWLPVGDATGAALKGGGNAGSEGDAEPAAVPSDPEGAVPSGEYTAGTTHGTRWRGWRRALLPAVLAFAVATGGITAYEAISGNNISGGQGTSIGRALHGGSSGRGSGGTPGDAGTPSPPASGEGDRDGGPGPSTSPSGEPTDQNGGRHGGGGTPGEASPSSGDPTHGGGAHTSGGSEDSDGSGSSPDPGSSAGDPDGSDGSGGSSDSGTGKSPSEGHGRSGADNSDTTSGSSQDRTDSTSG